MSRKIDAVIDAAIAEKRIVGTVVLVVRHGEVVYRRAAGFSDREVARPMEENAVFRLSSVTKPIVTVAVLALIGKGAIGLEDPITRWLPDFRPRLKDGSQPEITVRHLLTHTSGLRYGMMQPPGSAYHLAGVSDGLDEPGLSMEENLRRIASVPLARPPGTGFEYSVAHDVLGAAVAVAYGSPLPEAVRMLVTEPLGMRNTSFDVREPERLVIPYADEKPEPRRMHSADVVPFGNGAISFSPNRAFDSRSFPSGGVGMIGTADDVARLLETVVMGGAPVVPTALAQAMITSQTGVLPINPLGPGWGFGFGVAVLLDPISAKWPHSTGTFRWGGVYGHNWLVDPVKRLTVVALTNTAIEGMIGTFASDLKDAAASP